MNAGQALTWSCNSYFAELAVTLQPGELRRAFSARGLLAATGFFPAESIAEFREPRTREQAQLAALGVEGIDPETLRKKNVVLIPRNTPLPVKITERFTTKSDGQRSIVLQVLEGESTLPSECTAIGRTVIRDLPAGLTKGWPIDVTFEYGSNGRLNVHAVVPGTSHEAKLDLERATGMSHAGIEHWKQPIGEAAGFNSFESMVQDVLGLIAPFDSPSETADISPLRAPTESSPEEGLSKNRSRISPRKPYQAIRRTR